MSPGADAPMPSLEASEKARGKMKERRSLSLETNSNLDRIAAAGVGRNGFVPTQEWVSCVSNFPSDICSYNVFLGYIVAARVWIHNHPSAEPFIHNFLDFR